MTTLTEVRPPSTRLRTARRVVSYAAILGTLPYLTLKFCWLIGIEAGITDPAFLHDSGIFLLNLFTAGMDVYAVGLALVFAHAWGQRAWPPLVLFPIWVGTGFLAPIAVGAPVVGLIMAVVPPEPAASGGAELPIAPWVQPLVYAGFAWQGIFLLTAFLLYAVERWSPVFTARLSGPSRAGWAPLGYTGAALAVATAAIHLSYAAGIGLSAAEAAGRTAVTSGVESIRGLAALAGAAGVVMLLRGVPAGWRFWVPTVLGWTGAGAMFSWGFWSLLNIAGSTLLAQGELGIVHLAHVTAQFLGGILLGAAVLRHCTHLTATSALTGPAAGGE
ncbi:MAG: hypothetical protein ACRDT4_25270 [Micromonosporaceae bacterium]